MNSRLSLLLIATVCSVVSHSPAAETSAVEVTSRIELFNGRDLTGWKPYLESKGNAKPEDVWSVKDGIIVCKGRPTGYLRTEKDYSNYVLRLEWRWPETTATGQNSGVFVHVSGEDKIWPKGVEAQLASGSAGDFWLLDNYKIDIDPSKRDPKSERHYFRTRDKVEKPLGQWNQYEITCRDKAVVLKINGDEVNRGSNTESSSGGIIVQSEGAEIHFRNITLEPLPK